MPLDVRMAQHDAIIKNKVFGDADVVLAIFPSPMIYGGPREVQWHATSRMFGGASHYIVGRDPAGMKHPGTKTDAYSMWHDLLPEQIIMWQWNHLIACAEVCEICSF